MSNNFIDKLIICNPYKEPEVNWKYDRDTQGFKKENHPKIEVINEKENKHLFKNIKTS